MDKLIWRKGGRAASIFFFCCNKYTQTPLHHFEHTVQGHCVCLCGVCNYTSIYYQIKKIQSPNSHLLDLLNNNSSFLPAQHLATPTLLLIHMNLIALDALGRNVLTSCISGPSCLVYLSMSSRFICTLVSARIHFLSKIILLHCLSMSHFVWSLTGI